MKKEYVLPIVFALLISSLSGTILVRQGYMLVVRGESTLIGGRVSENTTWTLEESPYIVVEDIVVEPDVYLTVEPGVVVKFTNAANLVIDGCLRAHGNSTHKILLSSNKTAPSRGDWGTINIRFHSTYVNCFDYCIIEYASTAVTTTADCNFTGCRIERNVKGIVLDNAESVHISKLLSANNTEEAISGSVVKTMTIEDSRISMNGQGVDMSDGYVDGYVEISARNVTVTENSGTGFSLEEVRGRIYNSNISCNGGNGVVGGALTLTNCDVAHNGANGAGIGWLSHAYMIGCTFLDNANGVVVGYESGVSLTQCNISRNREHGIKITGESGASVFNSSIADNQQDGIHSYSEWIGLGGATVHNSNISGNRNGVRLYFARICNSIIRNNSENGVWPMMTLDMEGSRVEHNMVGIYGGSDIRVSHSTISKNSLANIVTPESTCRFEYCNISNSFTGIQMTSGTIRYCNIYNHASYNVEYQGENNMEATHNWWGTTNETLIEESIYDYYEDYNLGRVLYEPYLTAPFTIPRDLSGPTVWVADGKCDMRDVALVAKLFGSIEGDGKYDSRADITGPTFLVADGKIDMRDVALVAKHYGEIYR